jgi:hypothetical protein
VRAQCDVVFRKPIRPKRKPLVAFVGDMQFGEGAEAAHSASANLTSVTAILRARHDDRLPLADLAAAAGDRYQLIQARSSA